MAAQARQRDDLDYGMVMDYAQQAEDDAAYWQSMYEQEAHRTRRQSRRNPHSNYHDDPQPRRRKLSPMEQFLYGLIITTLAAAALLRIGVLAVQPAETTVGDKAAWVTPTNATQAQRATPVVVIQPQPQQNVQIEWQPTDVPVAVEQPQPTAAVVQPAAVVHPTDVPIVEQIVNVVAPQPTTVPTLATADGDKGWYGGGASWAESTPEPAQQSSTSDIVDAVVSQPEPTNADGWGGGGASWADYTPVADSGWGGGSSK